MYMAGTENFTLRMLRHSLQIKGTLPCQITPQRKKYPSSINALYVISKITLQTKAKMEPYSTGCTTSKENYASGKKKGVNS